MLFKKTLKKSISILLINARDYFTCNCFFVFQCMFQKKNVSLGKMKCQNYSRNLTWLFPASGCHKVILILSTNLEQNCCSATYEACQWDMDNLFNVFERPSLESATDPVLNITHKQVSFLPVWKFVTRR